MTRTKSSKGLKIAKIANFFWAQIAEVANNLAKNRGNRQFLLHRGPENRQIAKNVFLIVTGPQKSRIWRKIARPGNTAY